MDPLQELHILVSRTTDRVHDDAVKHGLHRDHPMTIIGIKPDGCSQTFTVPTPPAHTSDAEDDVSMLVFLAHLRVLFARKGFTQYVRFGRFAIVTNDCMIPKMLQDIAEDIWRCCESHREAYYHRMLKKMPPSYMHPDAIDGYSVGAYNATHGVERSLRIIRDDEDGHFRYFGDIGCPAIEGEIKDTFHGPLCCLLYKGQVP